MLAGRLDRLVTVESRAVAQDASGQEIETWSTFAAAWAERRDMRGIERFAASQELAVRSATFRLRWLDGVDETMRLIDEGTTWNITGISGDRRKDWTELACEARDAAPAGG